MQKEEKKPDEKPVQKTATDQEIKAPEAKPKVSKPKNPKKTSGSKHDQKNGSKTFDEIFPDIEFGKEVTIDDQPGFYFKFESGRLRKFSDNGAYIDSAPLYTFQKFNGWRLKK